MKKGAGEKSLLFCEPGRRGGGGEKMKSFHSMIIRRGNQRLEKKRRKGGLFFSTYGLYWKGGKRIITLVTKYSTAHGPKRGKKGIQIIPIGHVTEAEKGGGGAHTEKRSSSPIVPGGLRKQVT